MRQLIAESPAVDHCYKILAGKWRRYHGVGFWSHFKDVSTLLKNLRDIVYFVFGFWQSLFIMLFWRPNIVFAKGGFVSLPVGLAAAFLRVPIVTHDSDATPGLTNRILAKYAKALAVGLPVEAYKGVYPSQKMHYTGVPVRPEYLQLANKSIVPIRQALGYKLSDKIITIIGGSLGAVRLNKAVQKTIKNLLSNEAHQLVWVTGSRQYDEIQIFLKTLSPKIANRIKVYNFINNLAEVLVASDIVVSRAGATALAELAILKKPTVLVPNPFLTGGHQLQNAAILQSQTAALVLQEKQIEADAHLLTNTVEEVLTDSKLRQKLAKNLNKLAVKDATTKIVDVIEGAL